MTEIEKEGEEKAGREIAKKHGEEGSKECEMKGWGKELKREMESKK